MSGEKPRGLLLCDDLIFSSRIVGTARDLGLEIKPFKTAEGLLSAAGKDHPSCVIIDLSNPSLKLGELAPQLRSLRAPTPRIVAYGSHVDTQTLQAARDAGCDPVLARSKFVECLPSALSGWLERQA
jgi:CheY-like chemotaxis protein